MDSILVSAPLGNHLTALQKRLGRWRPEERSGVGVRSFHFLGKTIYMHKAGFGRLHASEEMVKAATAFEPDHILFIGVAGGLKTDFSVGDPFFVASSVLWPSDSDTLSINRAIGLESAYESGAMPLVEHAKGGKRVRRARMLSVDSFVNTVREKRKLGIAGYDLVDMEYAAVVQALTEAGFDPPTGLMTVSDTVHHGFPSFRPGASNRYRGRIPPKLRLNMNIAAQHLGSFVHLWLRALINTGK